MDLSLDEIIKNKNITISSNKKIGGFKKQPRLPIKSASPVKDARLKIIQKNRAKIRDARDKLAELTRNNGDVRKKLIGRQQSKTADKGLTGSHKTIRTSTSTGGRLSTNGRVRKISTNSGLKTKNSKLSNYRRQTIQPIIRKSPRQVPLTIPRGYIDYDNMEDIEQEEYAGVTHLSRTVKNDLPPPAPRRINTWGTPTEHHYDPFDVYEVSGDNRRSRHMSPGLSPSKDVMRVDSRERSRSPLNYQQPHRYMPEISSHLSYEMRTRLERAPDPRASMGIFSNPLKQNSTMAPSSLGYRIVVSNLHPSVSQADIQELFEDIGELYDARMVRPGIAEVVYKTLLDAENAVDTYHNRQLDGQPMKCLLVNPRVSNKPTAPAIRSSSSQSSKKTSMEIDIDALHKVLFRRH